MATKRAGVRRGYTNGERTALLARYDRSEQTQIVFCTKEGISVPTLANWRKAREGMKVGRNDGTLVEVKMEK